ncbi:RNA polymerase sigma factor [Tsukamurella pseudospumae]|uniref:RNA polymerase subunit sigma-24 n=1 Tax=Tsukamurella pseudospumae TaxID=239498 RepID=A0A137YZ04_9ACTN|nr:DUF6596 domain-containing protein [Tsukamurella pseudospumae]KXO91176.1 hypothetical protein AXK61_06305 [Tsukamurella pseudospumae]
MTPAVGEDMLRRETPHVLAALVRRYGDFAACEDAVQEALVDASRQWPADGVPAKPRGWLVRVASRRYLDGHRQDIARLRREHRVALLDGVDRVTDPAAPLEDHDASLEVLTYCCHPALTIESQVTLALRTVLGLSTKQIAAVYLIPSATVGQRISRAKATIDLQHRRFPPPATRQERLPAVMHALYLMYTAGHSRSVGGHLLDVDVTTEAIRLARLLHNELPEETETAGLLALMLLSEARRPARTTPDGDLVPLRDQDRGRWDRTGVAEGVVLIEAALPTGPVGPYQLQAAISAVHAEAPTWERTDWPQIAALYAMLARSAPSPAVMLNYAVAINEVHGPARALRMLEPLLNDPRLRGSHRLYAVRAPILEAFGRRDEALADYRTAARLCTNIPEQRFLNARIEALGIEPDGAGPA